jgi:5-methylcytosine-specific restriction protein B
MVRHSNTWIFNIDEENWAVAVNGPDDPEIHGHDHVDNPIHGIRSDAPRTGDDIQPGDLVLARITGDESVIAGIWEVDEVVATEGNQERNIFDDHDYAWVIYCLPIQREFDALFGEQWNRFADILNTTVPSVTANIRGAVSSLEPNYKQVYLTGLLRQESLTEAARKRLQSELDGMEQVLDMGASGQITSGTTEQPDDDTSGARGTKLEGRPEPPTRGSTIARQLSAAGQIVFHGPPGTGKTHTAQQFARWWLPKQTDGQPTKDQLATITFHPAFTYEDFIEGLTADADGGSVQYRVKDGIFKQFCARARTAYEQAPPGDPGPPYILIIDEINRGNLPQIFGETVTLLEDDKRLGQPNETTVTLPRSDDSFGVPPNVYVIGTMNTADRSIALVDAAIRRRFRFLSFPADVSVLVDAYGFASRDDLLSTIETSVDWPLTLLALSIATLEALNERILTAPDLGKGSQVGHTYLLGFPTGVSDATKLQWLTDVWQFEILPLLEEYYFGQFDRLRQDLFDGGGERLFAWERQEIAPIEPEDLLHTFTSLTGVEPRAESSTVGETLSVLRDQGVLAVGDDLEFDPDHRSALENEGGASSDEFWHAVVVESEESLALEWAHDADGERYSLAQLAEIIISEYAGSMSPVAGADYWQLQGDGQSLSKAAAAARTAGVETTDQQA